MKPSSCRRSSFTKMATSFLMFSIALGKGPLRSPTSSIAEIRRTLQNNDNDNEDEGPYDFDKNPVKSSPECSSFNNGNGNAYYDADRPPCRVSDDESPTYGGGEVPDQGFVEGSNRLYFYFFDSLRPGQPSLGRAVTRAVTSYVNATHDNFVLYLRGNGRLLQGSIPTTGLNLFHLQTDSLLVKRLPDKWWWQYTLFFSCFSSESHIPATDADLLESVSQQISSDLEVDISSGRFQAWVLDNIDEPIGMDFTTLPDRFLDNSSGHGSMDWPEDDKWLPGPLDTKAWDWRRYLGLGIFISTICVTFVLTQLAAFRHRRLREQELWGNLATIEGVDEMLKTGWKIQGSQLELYDKSKIGYFDDDSMLIGNFEHCVAVGAEITVTQPVSEGTPAESALTRHP